MKYKLIYADPPWKYDDEANAGKRGACHKYQVMTLGAIKALPVASIADKDCLLALWWTGTHMKEAIAVAEAWGFKVYSGTGFTWHKLTCTGKKDAFGMGSLTRGNAENCLFATRGKLKRQCKGVRQLITAKVGRHSEKPAEARDRLVRLLGDVPRIELFARVATPGWDVWGNEVESTIELERTNEHDRTT